MVTTVSFNTLIVAFITVIALSDEIKEVKRVNRQKNRNVGEGEEEIKRAFLCDPFAFIRYFTCRDTFINFASHTGGNATLHRYRSTERTDRDKLRVRLAMLLIDRARSMYICVQLYVRYKHMYNNRRERRSNVV